MNRWFIGFWLALAFALGAQASEEGNTAGRWRDMTPEETRAVLKDVGIVVKDKPTYPNVAYRLYPKPYQVFELATVGYLPLEQEDGSPLDGTNPDDLEIWGPDGEPVVILLKPGAGMWMEGFFSRKRVEVDLDRYTYRYRKSFNDRESRSETPDPINVEVFNRPKSYDSDWIRLFASPRVISSSRAFETAFASYLSRYLSSSAKGNSILGLIKEIDTLPFPLGKEIQRGRKLADCEPLVWFIERMTVEDVTRRREGGIFWAKTIVRYYPLGQTPPMGKMPWCPQRTPLVSWPDGSQTVNHGDNSNPHLLPDGSILVKLGTDAVVRLRWEDGEPVGPLPPFIKVIDAREVIWAKLDLLRRYRDEMKRRGIKDATKLRTPTQIMHDLAAYFFDIQEIKNWKGDDK